MNRGIIFCLGALVGAAVGSLITYRKVIQNKEEEFEAEIADIREYYERRVTEKEKSISGVDDTNKEFTKASYSDYISEHKSLDDSNKQVVAYHKIYKEDDEPVQVEEEEYHHMAVPKQRVESIEDEIIELYLFDTEEPDEKIIVDEDEDMYDFNEFKPVYDNRSLWYDENTFVCENADHRYYRVHLRDEEYAKGIIDDILWSENGSEEGE